jgi:hypothetical protein
MIVLTLAWDTEVIQSHAMEVEILSFVVCPPPERVFDIFNGLSHVFVKFVGNN